MQYLYKLRIDVIYDEDKQPCTTYGIDCLCNGRIVAFVEDIFFDLQKAEAFVKLCNDTKLLPAYLETIAQNAVEEYHKIKK